MTAAWTTPTTDPCTCPWCTIAAAIWARAKDAPDHPLSRAQLAALEVDVEDPSLGGGFPDYYADIEAADAENRAIRSADSALDWLERGGVS